MEAPLLIEADVKEKADRTPAWVHRADWSSKDALIAFWSAHPPELRDDFLNTRAESYATNMRQEIKRLRLEQFRLWQRRRALIAEEAEKLATLVQDEYLSKRQRDLRKTYEAHLLKLRFEMQTTRREIRRCLRYLRAIMPKPKKTQSTILREMVEAITGKHVNIVRPQTYKVLSLWQPWASMIGWGLKQYETRSWTTEYRGVILIHAAKRWTEEEIRYCSLYPFGQAIADKLGGAISDLPRGCIVASAELVEIVPTATLKGISREERAVGNFAPGRFAWKLANVRELTPIDVKGGQGLFDWTGVI